MKNKLIIEQNDKEVKHYRPLIKLETDKDTYIIYTENKKNDLGDIICYAGIYEMVDGNQVLKPIKDEETLEFLDSILINVQNSMNKKESSD